MQNILRMNFDLSFACNRIWESYDGEAYMLTIDHLKPRIDLIAFNTFFPILNEKTKNAKCGLINIRNQDDDRFKWRMKYHQRETTEKHHYDRKTQTAKY